MSRRSRSFNAFEQATTAAIDDAVTSIPLDSVTNLTPPGYLVIDPDDPLLREYIFYTTINALVLEDVSRGLAGSAGGVPQEHGAGARVRAVSVHQWLDDLFDDIEDLEDGTAVIPTYLLLSGAAPMAGNLDMGGGGFRVVDMGNGLADQDAATVKQVTEADLLLLPLNGTRDMTGQLVGIDGTAAAPSFTFASDLTSGMFRLSANIIGFSVAGEDPSLEISNVWLRGRGINDFYLGLDGVLDDPTILTYTFRTDTDTGMYRKAANVIGWAAGGAEAMSLGNGLRIGSGANGAEPFMPTDADGSALKPAYAFDGSTTMGFYRSSTTSMAWAFAGVRAWQMTDVFFRGETVDSAYIVSDTGANSAGAPAHSFRGQSNMGMYAIATDALGLSVAGTEAARFASTQVRLIPVFDNTQTGTADMIVLSSGTLRRITSTMAHKHDYRSLPDPLEVIRNLNPFSFRSTNPNDDPDRRFVGMGAEEVAAVIPEADKGDNYDDRSVLAYLVAAVQKLIPVEV